MPEGVGYGPQSTASIGKDIHVIGNHAYAASGSITDAGSGSASTTLLSFTTGNYIFKGTLDFTTTNAAGHDSYLDVTFNGNLISETKESSSGLVPMRFHYIIPPYTTIEVKWGSNSTYNGSVFMAGRIYK